MVSPAMETPMPPDAAREIEYVKSLVARHFPVYDVKVRFDVVEFYCKIDETTMEESFGKLREEMAEHRYVPMVTYQKGEHVIIVGKKPQVKHRGVYVNLVMFAFTFIAITYAGVSLWAGYVNSPGDSAFSSENIAMGILVFTLPLLFILFAHEFGHFFMARRRKVAASLPFFIPMIPPLGTVGALTSLRDPVPDRKSLLEIGIAGPIAGLLVAIPVMVLGFVLTNAEARPIPDSFEGKVMISAAFPLMCDWIEFFVPAEGDFYSHPMVFAAWIGILLTAVNLLPAGPLDGGYIARAILGRNAKYATWGTVGLLIVLSLFWIVWIFIAMLVIFFGAKHPPPLNDITKLDTKRKIAGLFTFALLIITFTPVPLTVWTPDYSVNMTAADDIDAIIAPGETAVFSFWVENTGDTKNNITVFADDHPAGWVIQFKLSSSSDQTYASTIDRRFDIDENSSYSMRVTCGPSAPGEQKLTVIARSNSSQEDDVVEDSIEYTLDIGYPELEFWAIDSSLTIIKGENATAVVQVNNTYQVDLPLAFTANDLSATSVDLYEDEFDQNSTSLLELSVPAEDYATFTVLVSVASHAISGSQTISIEATYFDSVVDTIEINLTIV